MLLDTAQRDVDARWQLYEQIAGVHRVVADESGAPPPGAAGNGEAAGGAPATKSDGPAKPVPTEEAAP
jgi:hypothetical protein